MLYEEGRFKLDDPISIWLPDFKHLSVLPERASTNSEAHPLEREITFWHLLTHTAAAGCLRQRRTS
jgi:CubicO group peptidase (beta-lactamase class C family)